jgi:hypothetical protein
MDERGQRASVAFDVDDQRRVDFIPIPAPVPVVLVVALQLAAVDVERDNRIGIEVVARPGIPGPGAWIPRAPIGQIQLGVQGAGDPGRGAAGLPGVAGPGVVAELAGTQLSKTFAVNADEPASRNRCPVLGADSNVIIASSAAFRAATLSVAIMEGSA